MSKKQENEENEGEQVEEAEEKTTADIASDAIDALAEAKGHNRESGLAPNSGFRFGGLETEEHEDE